MEISTRQLLAPRPPVPIVRQGIPEDLAQSREYQERYAVVVMTDLLSQARTIKQARWALNSVRKKVLDHRNGWLPRPENGRMTAAIIEAYQALVAHNERCDARKAVKANSAIADVSH